MPEDTGEKTQDATPHRRQKAREEGQVAKSQDLGSAVVLLGGMLILLILGGGVINVLGGFAKRQFGGEAWLRADTNFILSQWYGLFEQLARVMLPLFALVFVVGALTNILQIGFLFLPNRLAPGFCMISENRYWRWSSWRHHKSLCF